MQLGVFAKTFPRPTLEETLDAVADRGSDRVFSSTCRARASRPCPSGSTRDLCHLDRPLR